MSFKTIANSRMQILLTMPVFLKHQMGSTAIASTADYLYVFRTAQTKLEQTLYIPFASYDSPLLDQAYSYYNLLSYAIISYTPD